MNTDKIAGLFTAFIIGAVLGGILVGKYVANDNLDLKKQLEQQRSIADDNNTLASGCRQELHKTKKLIGK